MEENQKAPLYESKTIQVYPNSYDEDKAIKLYEAGCWELASSNRTQERYGDTVSTFTRMTFRRNKNMPHYNEIAAASWELENLQGKTAKRHSRRLIVGILFSILGGLSLCVGLLMVLFGAAFWSAIPLILSVLFIILGINFAKKYINRQKVSDADFQKRVNEALEKMKQVREKYGI